MEHKEPGFSLVTLTSFLEEPDHTAVFTEFQQHNSVIMVVYQTCESQHPTPPKLRRADFLDCRTCQDSPLSAIVAALSSHLASPFANRACPFQNDPTFSFQTFLGPGDDGLVAKDTYIGQLTVTSTSSSRDPMASSGLHRNPHTCTHTHICNLKIKLSKISK